MKAMMGVPAVAALLLAAAPAMALEVREQATIKAPIEQVWKQIGPFCAIGDWHPAVESCNLRKTGKSQERDIALKGGGAIQERLTGLSAAERSAAGEELQLHHPAERGGRPHHPHHLVLEVRGQGRLRCGSPQDHRRHLHQRLRRVAQAAGIRPVTAPVAKTYRDMW